MNQMLKRLKGLFLFCASTGHLRRALQSIPWRAGCSQFLSCQSGSLLRQGPQFPGPAAQTGAGGDPPPCRRDTRHPEDGEMLESKWSPSFPGFALCAAGGRGPASDLDSPFPRVMATWQERAGDDLGSVTRWEHSAHQALQHSLVLVVITGEGLQQRFETHLHGQSQLRNLQVDQVTWEKGADQFQCGFIVHLSLEILSMLWYL